MAGLFDFKRTFSYIMILRYEGIIMYSIHLMNGQHLSAYDLKDIRKVEKLSDMGLDILKYLRDDIMKLDIDKIKRDKRKKG